jgi:Flp pilus assembly protein TadD
VEETRFEIVETSTDEEDDTPISFDSGGKVVLKDLFVDIMDSPGESETPEEPNFLERGRIEMSDGQISQAIVSLQKSIREPRYEAESCFLLGLCFLKENHGRLAEKFFKRGLNLRGQDDTYYNKLRYNLAVLYEMRDKIPDAITVLSDIAANDPEYEDVVARIQGLKASIG